MNFIFSKSVHAVIFCNHIGTLLYLTAVTNPFPITHFIYKPMMCKEQCVC